MTTEMGGKRGQRRTSNVQHPMMKEEIPLRHASRDTSPRQGRSTLVLIGERGRCWPPMNTEKGGKRRQRRTSNVQHPMRKEGVPLRHASRDTSPRQGRSTLDLERGCWLKRGRKKGGGNVQHRTFNIQ